MKLNIDKLIDEKNVRVIIFALWQPLAMTRRKENISAMSAGAIIVQKMILK